MGSLRNPPFLCSIHDDHPWSMAGRNLAARYRCSGDSTSQKLCDEGEHRVADWWRPKVNATQEEPPGVVVMVPMVRAVVNTIVICVVKLLRLVTKGQLIVH